MKSIVVPAYNASQTLPACLEALQKQTELPDEIIVVNDGSKDKTKQVALAYGVKVLEQSHQGPAVARNLGIDHACGEIVLFTDADCEPLSTWVAEMSTPFSDPKVAGVKGSYITHQRECIAKLVQYEFEDRYDHLERLSTIDFIDTYAAAFRTNVLRDMGGFDPAFPQAVSEDAELSYRLADAGYRLVFNRKATVYHRHPNTWSAYIRRKIKFAYWRMIAYRLHPGKAVRDSYTPQLLKWQIFLIYLIIILLTLGVIFPPIIWGVAAVFMCLCITAIPFIRRVIYQDNTLGAAALFFIIVRALALAIGVTGGMMGMFFFHPLIPRNR
jgi:cellulose synthase/poly-beta-1,6-N-acetylglucosamine synthase-like glycosyltransferase